MPKWATKMLQLATCCSIFVGKKTGAFNIQIYFWRFNTIKNVGVKVFMKLTPGLDFFKIIS